MLFKLHPDLFCSNGIHSLSSTEIDFDESLNLQNIGLSNSLNELIDEVRARLSRTSTPIHKRCCHVGDKLWAYKNHFVSRSKPTNTEAVAFILYSPDLETLQNHLQIFKNLKDPKILLENNMANWNTPWDARFLMRWNKFFRNILTNSSILFGRKLKVIQDPISEFFLPCYYAEGKNFILKYYD